MGYVFLSIMSLMGCWMLQAQESVRDLEEEGVQTKYLTPNQVDTWNIEGIANEIWMVHLQTHQFDPVLEIAGPDNKVWVEVDDPGSESWTVFHVPKDGNYEIRVRGFQYKGGGNYSLYIKRYTGTELALNTTQQGIFGENRKQLHFFQAQSGQIVVPYLQGQKLDAWTVFDSKGKPMQYLWESTIPITKDGLYYILLQGEPGNRYSIELRVAKVYGHCVQQEIKGSLETENMAVHELEGKAGQFWVLELEKEGRLKTRFIYQPRTISKWKDKSEPIQFFPIASKGNRLQWAVTLGRNDRYELQLLARSPVQYKLRILDPTCAISAPSVLTQTIPIAGTAFFTFLAKSGQWMRLSASSKDFDPILRLYHPNGQLIQENDDSLGFQSEIVMMFRESGLYRVQVGSVGHGGSGEFQLALTEQPVPQLAWNQKIQSTIASGSIHYWALQGQAQKTAIVYAESAAFTPYLELYSPQGILLAKTSSESANAGLFSITFPETGTYILWVQTTKDGQGAYTLRVLGVE